MDKLIAFTNLDNSVGILTPAPEMFDKDSRTRKELRAQGIDFKTEEQVWEYISKDLPAGMPWRFISPSAVPSDRTFREAWTDAFPTDTIDVDMNKARNIHRDKLRAQRVPLLAALDIEYLRADEDGDTGKKQEVIINKQKLRDVTAHARIASAGTPEALKALTLSALLK